MTGSASRIYFAGDVHLLPEHLPHPGRDLFLDFLSGLLDETPGELWITGDLFDFWFEYGSVMPAGYDRVLNALAAVRRAGWRTSFLPGNHDWWVGRHFAGATGFEIIRDQWVETSCFGTRTAVAHGDGLGGGDTGYRLLLKPVLRARLSRFLFSLLHPDLAALVARGASDTSRRILHGEIMHFPAGLSDWIRVRMSEGFGAVVTSHIHNGCLREIAGGTHISTGDWITTFTYARFGPDGPEIVRAKRS